MFAKAGCGGAQSGAGGKGSSQGGSSAQGGGGQNMGRSGYIGDDIIGVGAATAFESRQIEFRGELPKTDVGKVSRRELRDELT